LKKALEEYTEGEISDASLERTMKIYNENRRLLKHLYSLRRKSGPDISGTEILQIMKLGMIMPKTEHNILLKDWIDEVKKRPRTEDQKPRIAFSGSMLDNPDLLQEIEKGGCRIIADDICMGSRYFWDEVEGAGNPLESLSRRYLDRVPCSCIHPPQRRMDHLLSMVNEFEADGVIFYKLKFCDNYHYDAPPFREKLKSLGIPVLELESEYASSGYGQLKTRVQAFLEMISMKRRG
jgi:benzoyl-CoA reductase subunit C